MGKNFKDGPRGEPERFIDEEGNEVHVSMDNRGISASKRPALDRRLRSRELKRGVPSRQPSESDIAQSVYDRLAERGVSSDKYGAPVEPVAPELADGEE
jgi:hypothetical protein